MPRWLQRLLYRRTELDAAKAYALWAPNYPPFAHNPIMELEESAVLRVLPELKGMIALDVACGSGRYLKIMLQHGAALVVGLDASMPMLARAREFAPNLMQADLLSMGLRAGQFQVITCALALGHAQDLRSALTEIARVLAPQGAVIYSDFHPMAEPLGWKRTFRGKDGRQYTIRHYTHSFSEHMAACAAAGLHVAEVLEPTIDFDHKWRGCPALLIVRAIKPG
jgi:malonyl-CoA O-methyltransferase